MATRGIMERWDNTTVDTTYTNAVLAYSFCLSRSNWTVDGHAVQFTVHDSTSQLSTSAATAKITLPLAVNPAVPWLQVEYKSQGGNLGPAGRLYDDYYHPPVRPIFTLNKVCDIDNIGTFSNVTPYNKARTDSFLMWIRITVTRGAGACTATGRQLRFALQTATPVIIDTTVTLFPYLDPVAVAVGASNKYVAMVPVLVPATAPVGAWGPVLAYTGAGALADLFGGGGAVVEFATADGIL